MKKKKKIILGLVIYCFLFMAFSALPAEVNAQKIPGKAKKLKKQGDRLFSKRNYEQAIGKYAEAIILANNYDEAHFWKGYSHYNLYLIKDNEGDTSSQSELDLALDELNAAYSQGYEPLDVYKVRWYVNYKKQKYDEALEDIKRGLELENDNLTLKAGLADVYFSKKNYQDAVDNYVKVVDQIPNNGDVYYNIASSYYQLQNTTAQKIAAQKAIANRTKFIGESYFLIGDAFQKERNLSAAAEAYEQSLNTRKDIKDVYRNLSDIYRTQNKFTDAIEITKKGLREFPNDGYLYVDLSWYYSLADQYKDAVGSAQRALAFLPDYYMAHTNLCRGFNDLKEYVLAKQSCNRALKLNPGDGETNYYLGRSYAGLKDKEKASEYYKKSIPGLVKYTEDRPYYADAFYLLGNAYYEDNQNTLAIKSYERSLQLSPKFTKAIKNLAFAYFVGKEMDKAKEQYAKLLTLDPDKAKELAVYLDVK